MAVVGACVHAKSLQSCLTLCDPIDGTEQSWVLMCKEMPANGCPVESHIIMDAL